MIELHNEFKLNFGDNAVYGEQSDSQEDSDVCLRIKKAKELQQSGHIPTQKKLCCGLSVYKTISLW